MGSVQKTAYLTATIASVDGENDTACFEESGKCPAGSNIPIFYHCQYEEGEEPAQRDNGALEGAAGAFAEDDEVIVQCEVVDSTTYKPLYVMGFVDKPKRCLWEPWNGPELNSCNPWEIDYIPPGAIIEVGDGNLYISAGNPVVLSCFLPVPITATHCKFKVNAQIKNVIYSNGIIKLYISSGEGEWIAIVLAAAPQWPAIYNCVAGNPGHFVCVYKNHSQGVWWEDEVDLTPYIFGDINTVQIVFVDIYGSTTGVGDLLCDYITFLNK